MAATVAPAATAVSRLHLVISGHVDHGKSTVVGRLLADTGSLPDGKLDQVRALCERTSKPFEYAFLLDALRDERAQGITIDAARVFFKTAARHYVILDAPGHIEFLKNMITGAARAEAALLVIDAHEGIQENSRRHATMLSMLGIRQIAVVVNKMDLAGYAQATFDAVVAEFGAFLQKLGTTARAWIPVAARHGANIAARSAEMPWYSGATVLETLDRFEPDAPPRDRPFRMPVQDVYKFTNFGDDRRIVAGTVDSGQAEAGDELVFYPSGKRARLHAVEGFAAPARSGIAAGDAVGFTVVPQIYTSRGEIAARADQPPMHVTTRLRVNLFWLGRAPMTLRKDYGFRLGTARVPMRLEAIHRVIDASDLAEAAERAAVERHEVAECTLKLQRAIACDRAADLAITGRFVVIDDFDIRGGGIVIQPLPDSGSRCAARCGCATPSGPAATCRTSGAPSATASGRRCSSSPAIRAATARGWRATSKPGCSPTAASSTSSAWATCSTASTPTSSAARRSAASTCAGSPKSPT
jgi:bifunctional enzyme CysN/CysC